MMIITREEKKILEYLDMGLSATEVGRLLEVPHDMARVRIRKLRDKGLVEKVAYNRWFLTRKGLDAQVSALREIDIKVMRILCDQQVPVSKAHEVAGISKTNLKNIVKNLIKIGALERTDRGSYERSKPHMDKGIFLLI